MIGKSETCPTGRLQTEVVAGLAHRFNDAVADRGDFLRGKSAIRGADCQAIGDAFAVFGKRGADVLAHEFNFNQIASRGADEEAFDVAGGIA